MLDNKVKMIIPIIDNKGIIHSEKARGIYPGLDITSSFTSLVRLNKRGLKMKYKEGIKDNPPSTKETIPITFWKSNNEHIE